MNALFLTLLTAAALSALAEDGTEGAPVSAGEGEGAREAPVQKKSASRVHTSGAASATLAIGLDTNARRVIGEEEVTDVFASLTANAQGNLVVDGRHRIRGRYDLGARKFFDLSSEDMLVQQVSLGYSPTFGPWTLSADGVGKVRLTRNGARDYADVRGGLSGECQLPHGVALHLEGGARHFGYPHEDDYGFSDVHAGLGGSWKIIRTLRFALDVRGAFSTYEGHARASDASYDDERFRSDKTLTVTASLTWRGPVALQFGYLWSMNWSNSYGEDFERHRLFAAVVARLPWSIFVGLHVAWQSIHYPEGLFLSDDLIDLMLYDDESQSSSTLKISRPLNRYLEIELKYKLSWVKLPRRFGESSLDYLRQVGTLGLTARF